MLDHHEKEMESSKKIRSGAIISYVAIGINIIAGLLFTPWMIRQIGQNDYGLYTLAVSIISIFTLDFGLGEAVSRFVSKYHANNDQQSINRMLSITYRLFLFIDVIILMVLVLVYFNLGMIYQELSIGELEKFKVVYAIAAFYSVISLPLTPFYGILSAFEYFVDLKLSDLLRKFFSIVLITTALVSGWGLYALVASNVIADIISIGYKFYIIKNKTDISINLKYKNYSLTKEIFSFSTWAALISITQRLIFNITPTILGALSGAIDIAVFGVASILEGNVYIIAGGLNGLFLPKVNRILTRDDANNNILSLMIKVGRIQLLIVGLIIIGFVSIGKDFILLWLNEDYLMTYYSTILLILPGFIHLTQQIGDTAIIAMNKVKQQAYLSILVGFGNVLLSTILSAYFGAVGASGAIFISYLLQSIGKNLIYKKHLDLDVWRFFKECHVQMVIPLGVTLLISLSIDFLPLELSWMNLILKGILIVFVYFVMMWTFVMNDFEKGIFESVFNR